MSQFPGRSVPNPHMKHLALSLTLGFSALVATPAVAQPSLDGDGAWMADYDAAAKLAKEQGKDLLVDFTGSDWCGWCIKLHEEVFAVDGWEDKASADYILVALDFPHAEEIKAKVPDPKRNAELQKLYGVQGFPTILLMTADGDVFGRMGYQPGGPEQYLKDMAANKVKGMAQLKAVKDLVGKFEAAGADAKHGLIKEVAAFIKKEGADVAGSRHLLPILEEGMTMDPTNEHGIGAAALTGLMSLDKFEPEWFTNAKSWDAKNESGLYEVALKASMKSVASDETMLVFLDDAMAYLDLGKVVDKEIAKHVFSFAAYFAMDKKEDMELATAFAEASKANGGLEDETFGELIGQILNGEEEEVVEEEVEPEEEVEEEEEPVVEDPVVEEPVVKEPK